MKLQSFPESQVLGPYFYALNQSIQQMLADPNEPIDYFKMFNQDAQTLNQLIKDPPSLHIYYQRAYALQEEYNVALDYSQQRWVKHTQNLVVGANAIKNLAFIKREFNQSLKLKKIFEQKQQRLKNTCTAFGPTQFWETLNKIAQLLDSNDGAQRTHKLEKLAADWERQGQLVTLNTQELLKLHKELKEFSWFNTLFMRGAKQFNGESDFAPIQKVISQNKATIKQLQQQITAALAWRFHAGSLRENVFFDDQLWAIVYRIRGILGTQASNRYNWLILPKPPYSQANSSIYIANVENIIRLSQDRRDYNKWRSSSWLCREPQQQLIPSVVLDEQLIPQALQHYLTPSSRFNFGAKIRNLYFQSCYPIKGFWGWFKNLYIGYPNSVLLVINDAAKQLDRLYRELANNQSLALNRLNEETAFKSALALPLILNTEKQRLQRYRFPKWLVLMFSWIPWLEIKRNADFFNQWYAMLEACAQKLQVKCQKIIDKLLPHLRNQILREIENQRYRLSAKYLSEVNKFISIYGNDSSQAVFAELISPSYIFNLFNFCKDSKNLDFYRDIDEETIYAFLEYAEKYWDKATVKAAYKIADILLGKAYPRNSLEEHEFIQTLNAWTTAPNQAEVLHEFLNQLGMTYVLRTADSTNPWAYRFLQRFAPAGAQIWQLERDKFIEGQFLELFDLFKIKPGNEVDLSQAVKVVKANMPDTLLEKYKSYINNIKIEPKFKAHYFAALLDIVQDYVSKYTGANASYNLLIYDLCLADAKSISILEKLIMKRLQYLCQAKQASVINLEDNEIIFFKKIFDIDRLQKVFKVTLKKHYNGKVNMLSDIMLAIQQPHIASWYFAKRAQWLIVNGDYLRAYTEYQDLEPLFLSGNELSAQMHDFFSQLILSLTQQQLLMNNPSFYLLVQHLGSAANQEQLRLLKLESVLYANDKRSVDGFFSEITDFFQDKNYQTLFTLPENQQAVKQLFDKFITEQQEKNQWQGNAQAILEKLNLAYLKPALYRVRLLWLSEILFNINAFAQRNILERQTQDLNLHFNNLAVPNDEMALIQFMGVNTIEQVKKLIMQRLDCLEVGLDATVLNLLSQYINSTELRKDSISWPLLDSKLGYYNLAQAAIQSLQAQDYPDLLDKFQKLRSELAAAQLLEKSNKAEIFLQKRNYYKMTLKKLEQIIVEKFKYNLLPPSIIANQYSVKNLNLDYFDTMIEPFYHEFIQRAIKDLSVADVVTDLYQHKTVIAKKSFDLIHSLDPDYIQNLNLTGQDAIMFRNSLSFATRRLLGEKLKLLASGLPNLNPLTKAIMAFHSLLFIEENNFKALSQPHFNVLKSFKIKRQRYPKIGEAMVKQVIDSLKQATFINDIALFHEYNSNFLDNLSKWLEPNTLAQLTHELLNRIKQLQAMTANKQIEQQRTEWLCYRKLLDIVLMSKNEELVLAIDEMVDAAYAHVNKSLQVLEKNIDRNIEHTPVNNWFTLRSISENLESLLSVGALHQPSFIAESDIIQEERNLLKDALFVRAFGNASHQKYLTEFLEKIGLKQRRAMMRGVFNPFIEHGLEFVDNLMTLAGTPEQRRRNADLVAAWCSYRQNQQPGNISQVRKLALQEALPQYGRYLQHNIYHYFGEQFGFIDSKLYTYFCKKLQNLASKWVASSHLVEPAEIWEAERGFFERLMQDISQQRKKNIYNLFTNPNKEKYVARLYIAFCLNVRAQQLIKIWQDKLQSNNLTQVQYFSASTMESALTKMLVDLTEQFGVSSQRYKQALTVTIASQASIFVCWAPTQTKPLELLSSAQLTEKMKA